jgi:agmatine/peptidylarginine deiminase
MKRRIVISELLALAVIILCGSAVKAQVAFNLEAVDAKNIPAAAVAAPEPKAAAQRGALQDGPPQEFLPVKGLLLINFDGFEPVLAMHRAILAGLPADQKAVIVAPEELKGEYLKAFKKDFSSGRFRVYSGFTKVWDPMLQLYGNWARDFVPQFVGTSKGWRFVRFADSRTEAVKVTDKLFGSAGLPLAVSKLTFQFGNAMTDANNILYTTQRVMRANPGVAQAEIVKELKTRLNVADVIILPELPDESTGHIDMFAKFVNYNTVLVADSGNAKKKKMLDSLAALFTKAEYRVLRVLNAEAGAEASVMSYTNSTIVNGTVFVPGYAAADPKTEGVSAAQNRTYLERDEAAKRLYSGLGFKVVQVPSRDIIKMGGAVHCMTRELPAAMPDLRF